jgi:thymidylate synthase (FAD)
LSQILGLDPAEIQNELYLLYRDPALPEDQQGCTPAFPQFTEQETPYFQSPGVALVSSPVSHVRGVGVEDFLRGYSEEFTGYQDDPDTLDPATEIAKFAGQLCYLSLAQQRTMNAEAGKYFKNIICSAHGSVFEHVYFGFLFYGVSRSFTHELVRHRVGIAFSQVSQRYVGADVVRFVERPEYQAHPDLHNRFEDRIDRVRQEYEEVTTTLAARHPCADGTRTERRKAVQQAARSVLPNETEAPIVCSANIRTWRNIIDLRLSPHAEPEIRAVFLRVFLRLWSIAPALLQDYRLYRLPDASYAVTSDNRKV